VHIADFAESGEYAYAAYFKYVGVERFAKKVVGSVLEGVTYYLGVFFATNHYYYRIWLREFYHGVDIFLLQYSIKVYNYGKVCAHLQ
jgi:hypothetical protein